MNVFGDFFKALLKRKFIMLAAICVSAATSMIVFRYVPKKYKSSAVISIQPGYFQNAMVRDFIPEPSESGELRGARETLIRHSLNHAFILEIGQKYGLLKSTSPSFRGVEETNFEDEMSNSFDLELLLQRFEIIGAGPSSFLIGFSASDPITSYKVVEDAMARIRETMQRERHDSLERLRLAIQTRIEALSFGHESGVGPAAASRPDLLRAQVDSLESELQALRLQYSDKHPKVEEVRAKLEEMKKWLKSNAIPPKDLGNSPIIANTKFSEGSSKELFQDLLKKYHYLEIAIAMDNENTEGYMTVVQEPIVPHAALWPKRPIFLIWGVAIGFLVGSLLVFLLELTGSAPVMTKLKEFFVAEQSA